MKTYEECREHQANPYEDFAYQAGRLARQQGCHRVLCIGTDGERREWFRGWDDQDAEMRQMETQV